LNHREKLDDREQRFFVDRKALPRLCSPISEPSSAAPHRYSTTT
jgi:hypothetical protein